MHIRVRLFALLREKLGASELRLEIAAGATPADVLAQLFPGDPASHALPSSLLFAVNQAKVPADHPLKDGDELALIPPVSGG